jgi:hypothetical protein
MRFRIGNKFIINWDRLLADKIHTKETREFLMSRRKTEEGKILTVVSVLRNGTLLVYGNEGYSIGVSFVERFKR